MQVGEVLKNKEEILRRYNENASDKNVAVSREKGQVS